ncbi:twin-arginine translocation protein TatB [alpha proteobacterium U9-1i]|nr:twin-arginine translocation protein TatB [alpha proteobacterium U9-1i]
MLPSLGFNEILILGVLALVVIGPKDLPLMLRKLGRWTAKLRGMAQEFRTGFDELARQAELDELKKEVDALRRTTNLQSIASDLSKPLPTLEDYAGIAKPKPLTTPDGASASSSMEEAPRSGGGGARAGGGNEPLEATPSTMAATPPQSSLRDDSSPIEGELSDEPIARSAP